MATNWIQPVGQDLRKVLEASAQYDTNQNTAEGTASGDETDLAQANRRDQLVALAVADVRGAVAAAGRHPLSVTAGAVPPEAVWHTLVIAAWRLVNSTPGLTRSFLAGDGGAETPMGRMYAEARAYVWGEGVPKNGGLAQGATMTPPTDPTGEDYATAVEDDPADAAYNPMLRGIRWGDQTSPDTGYYAGHVTDTATGALVELPSGTDMRI